MTRYEERLAAQKSGFGAQPGAAPEAAPQPAPPAGRSLGARPLSPQAAQYLNTPPAGVFKPLEAPPTAPATPTAVQRLGGLVAGVGIGHELNRAFGPAFDELDARAAAAAPKVPVQPVVDAALKVSGAGAASSAVPPAAPTPAAQGAKPGQMMTQPEQQAAGIQQRSQSTPAANIGTAPGKQPAAGGFGVDRLTVGNVQPGQGVIQGADGRSVQINGNQITSFGANGAVGSSRTVADVRPEDRDAAMKRSEEATRYMNGVRAGDAYRGAILKAGEYRDPMQRAMMMKAASDQYGATTGGMITDKDNVQLGIQKQQADAQTTNAGANVTQAEAQKFTAQKPTPAKTDIRNVKVPNGQRHPKTNEPYYDELQVAYNPDGTPTAASAQAIQSYLQNQAQGKIQSEQDNRGFFSNLFSSGLTPEEIQSQAATQASQMAARYGVGAQPQAQIDPSQIVMVNGVPHKQVP
jgi:hypothetical protein